MNSQKHTTPPVLCKAMSVLPETQVRQSAPGFPALRPAVEE